MGEDQCPGPGPAPVQVRATHPPVCHHHLQLRVRMDAQVLSGIVGVPDRSLKPEAHKRLFRGSDLRGKRDFINGLRGKVSQVEGTV